MVLLDNEIGEIEGIPIERKEVGISDNCVQTLLKLQIMENAIRQVAEGKVVFRPNIPREGRTTDVEVFNRIRYGGLISNAEIYSCLKRACATLDAVRESRLGQFQIRGTEREKHMKAYDEETAEGKVDHIYGRIKQIVDEAATVAGLTKRQYENWGRTERMGNSTENNRGRSPSKRRKDKREVDDRVARETSANRRDRQSKADEERKRRKS